MNQSRFVSAVVVMPSLNSLFRPGLYPVQVSLPIPSAKQGKQTISFIGPQCHALPRAIMKSLKGITEAIHLNVMTFKADLLEGAAL